MTIAILDGGIAGCCIALQLAKLGYPVTLYEKHAMLMTEASLNNEGKLHLGYVYAADPTGKTYLKMIQDSQQFLHDISELTGLSKDWFHCSQPFIYGVANDSLLDVEVINSHFKQVDAAIGQVGSRSRIKDIEAAGLNSKNLQAAFQTKEFCVNPAQVAASLVASVMCNPRIEVKLNTFILSSSIANSNSYQLELQHLEHINTVNHSIVINCTWGDRRRLDEQLGIIAIRPTMLRYKLSIQFNDLPHLPKLPSLTLITGSYGDIVNHGNGSYFLSWYPVCKIAETTLSDPAPLDKAAKKIDPNSLINETFKSLTDFAPELAKLLPYKKSARIAGGIISGWGNTDIDDINSELHQRHDIGFSDNNGWISVDTGNTVLQH